MILDGKKISEKVLEKIKYEVSLLKRKPHLAVILVGDDPASKIYVNNKQKRLIKTFKSSVLSNTNKIIKK